MSARWPEQTWRITRLSAHLGRNEVVRIVTMVFLPAPLAPIRPKSSPPETETTDVLDGRYRADVAAEPRRHACGRWREPSVLHPETRRSAVRDRPDRDHAIMPPPGASETRSGGTAQSRSDFLRSGYSQDIPIPRLTREGFIQISLVSTVIGGVGWLAAPHHCRSRASRQERTQHDAWLGVIQLAPGRCSFVRC